MAVGVALALLRGYKLLISPYFAGSCRFLPSCSDFARDAIIHHGVVRGTWLAARRLIRCHPLGSSGFDPVPMAVQRRLAGAPERSTSSRRSAGLPPSLEAPAARHSLGGAIHGCKK